MRLDRVWVEWSLKSPAKGIGLSSEPLILPPVCHKNALKIDSWARQDFSIVGQGWGLDICIFNRLI